MDNNQVDYENDIDEGFGNGINQDIALKTIIFSMLFYIIDTKLINKLIENYLIWIFYNRRAKKMGVFP